MSRNRLYLLILSVTAAGYAWVWLTIYRDGVPLLGCLFRKVTGLPCPACGSTKSVTALLSGDWTGVLAHNPLGVFTVLLALMIQVWIIIDLITRNDGFYRAYCHLEQKFKGKYLIAFCIVIILIWIRNIINHP